MIKNINDIGFNFDNSYLNMSKILMTEIDPVPVKSPKLEILNYQLAKKLDLKINGIKDSKIASLLSGNILPKGSKSIAQAYAGHQFGYLNILGDGRATLLGEHLTFNNNRYDIQLKGSGKTPYSRGGDGRATLISMMREYLISESMHKLKIPTTRSLSVVSTGENVQRENSLMGGILTRVASSHIRVGTFQYLAIKGDKASLKDLIIYCLKRHYPNKIIEINPAITLLKLVMEKQISLIINWMRVGFIHGVMNTDNMTISGETIDYGPCAFLNTYIPTKVYSSIDRGSRYSFINQSIIAHWNISRLAETLIPFFDNSEDKSIEIGKKIINEFEYIYKKKWLNMMIKKIGLSEYHKEDNNLIKDLLNWMMENQADYSNTFIYLMNKKNFNEKIYETKTFNDIRKKIDKRIKDNDTNKELSEKIMSDNNPLIIPRNHNVEEALSLINTKKDFTLFNKLLSFIDKPYENKKNLEAYQKPPDSFFEKNYRTYCGT